MRKKGFTLIELLAVIVILAVIALITVPGIFNVVNEVRTQSFLRGIDSIVRASETEYAKNGNYGYQVIITDGVVTSPDTIVLKGKKPDHAIVEVNSLGQISLAVWNEELKTCVLKNFNETSYTLSTLEDPSECLSTFGEVVEVTFAKVNDINPGIIFGTALTEGYALNTVAYINSIEDIVALSNLVKTNNFSGKTISLEANLDFNNNNSYVDSNTNVFGDINENGTIESLKIELTTGKGYYPIGTIAMPFTGTFDGNGKIIKNLYINRIGVDNIGFFGKTNTTAIVANTMFDSPTLTGNNYVGIIASPTIVNAKGITITNANIKGNDYVGGLVGFSSNASTILSTIYVSGNIEGNNYVGGIVGSLQLNATARNTISYANVKGASYVAGIIGSLYNSGTWGKLENSVYMGTTIDVTTASIYYGRASGRQNCTICYANKDATLKGTPVVSNVITSTNGYDIPYTEKNNIGVFSNIIDTYAGGDNDLDGYYFDYNDLGNIIISKAITTTGLTGSGTDLDPYLIYTKEDYKKATFDFTKSYKLMANLDFENGLVYPFGSYILTFTGKFDGNGHSLSNIKLMGFENVGLFPYVSGGTISNLTVNNLNLTGYNNVGLIGRMFSNSVVKGIILNDFNIVANGTYGGGLLGYNLGIAVTIEHVVGNGTVTAGNGAGGLIGRTISGQTINYLVVTNVNVTSPGNNAAGVIGYLTSDCDYEGLILIDGVISAVNARRINSYGNVGTALANVTVLVNGVTRSATTLYNADGRNATLTELQTQATYTALGFNFTDITPGLYKWELVNNLPTFKKNI